MGNENHPPDTRGVNYSPDARGVKIFYQEPRQLNRRTSTLHNPKDESVHQSNGLLIPISTGGEDFNDHGFAKGRASDGGDARLGSERSKPSELRCVQHLPFLASCSSFGCIPPAREATTAGAQECCALRELFGGLGFFRVGLRSSSPFRRGNHCGRFRRTGAVVVFVVWLIKVPAATEWPDKIWKSPNVTSVWREMEKEI
ncbi:hypothetical protein MUK42_34041 [Musa troglodytarum]|uniref:Uncharacterized protein n=1 Tax=Musa troglodytarum TaxID=320322 RepID=A0A9E7K8E5_9LILI|nr:hypothetical protein MUK42_34041 [Musa troglodytarum]